MAHTYLLDLYKVLTERCQQSAFTPADESSDDAALRQGRNAAAGEVLAFLRENYHTRLPRRLQREALGLFAEKNVNLTTGEDR